jgi:hypothetical protein
MLILGADAMNPVTPKTCPKPGPAPSPVAAPWPIDIAERGSPPRLRVRETTTLVALLVWTYQRQKADLMSGKGLWTSEAKALDAEAEAPQHWSGCGCAQLAAVAALGARIEAGGWQRPTLHPDADLVHDLVVEISKTDWAGAMLLRRYARHGAMPEWSEGRQEFEPERDAKDRIVQDRYDEVALIPGAQGQPRAVPVRYCPVRLYPSDAWVEMTRGEYRLWHRALQRLGEALAARRLTRWTIASLGAAAEPWNGRATESESEIR